MTTGKPGKTAADYMVIAASPALIMVMVHSLCFFLADIFFQTEVLGGVHWVLFWFVLAVVLIARIGMEQGDVHATVYGVALAVVVCLYLATFHLNVIFGAVLLAVVWFTAHKITLNCTLIDEDDDASGQGLMQSMRRLPAWLKKAQPANEPPPVPSAPVVPVKKAKRNRTQTPGVWLIYFSLAALPIFGLGQTLLPAGDLAARHRGFVYLFCYLAAALGLLVATSFLGLRRYLRQRYLSMPGSIAFGWIQFGAAAMLIVLCLSLFLPRPGAGEAWVSLRHHVDYQLHRASNYAARFNPHGSGSGRAGDQASADGKEENRSAQPDQKPGANQDKHAGKGDDGEQQPGGTAKSDGPTGQSGGKNPGTEAPASPPPAGSAYSWLRVLFWLIVAAGFIWLLYRYRAPILLALRSIWTALRNFFADLFGHGQPKSPVPPVAVNMTAVTPFKTFKNPFLTGSDQVWTPEKLIIYSYNAIQSCAREQKSAPVSPQTPREFCRQLSLEMPDAANELEYLAYLYGHVAYGLSLPASYDAEHLRQLWSKLPGPQKMM